MYNNYSDESVLLLAIIDTFMDNNRTISGKISVKINVISILNTFYNRVLRKNPTLYIKGTIRSP